MKKYEVEIVSLTTTVLPIKAETREEAFAYAEIEFKKLRPEDDVWAEYAWEMKRGKRLE
tara:strand:- start:51 stop:227 length:177 start_codon:yes stop_codon:yes gene_type:complete